MVRDSFPHALPVPPSEPLGQTLLLVEDNEDNRIIYSTVLRHIGYEVVEAVDGVQAISLARSVLPDLILMDISIPEIDGWEATRILRQDAQTKDIPIIALTAHALADDRERAQAVGFTAYLAKPVEPRAVVAEVQRWIGVRGRGDATGAGTPPSAG
jgi:two-component system cell cycle response regulator DivK